MQAATREFAALVTALAVWAGLSLAIIALAWRPTSLWLCVALPLYLPGPIAAFVYVLLIHPRSWEASVKRSLFLAAVGLALASPVPDYPLWTRLPSVLLHFHPMSLTGEDPLLGMVVVSLLSSLLIGPIYCGYLGYWAGRLAGLL